MKLESVFSASGLSTVGPPPMVANPKLPAAENVPVAAYVWPFARGKMDCPLSALTERTWWLVVLPWAK